MGADLRVVLDTNVVISALLLRRSLTRQEERMEFLTAYVREATLVNVTETVKACRDPRDDKFLDLAVSGHATHIVTGDAGLLALHPFRKISILAPRLFMGSTP